MSSDAVQSYQFQQAAELLAGLSLAEDLPAETRLDIKLAPEVLLQAVQALVDARWGYLSAILGLDDGQETLEVLYSFCSGPYVLTLRAQTPRDDSRVPTITGLIPSAILPERELREMFGVEVVDIPDSSPLFLADDWPADVFPMRKDAVLPNFNEEQSS
ncbi:MAG: NADH-quinone oxidoreductase subunit C [Anaerolineales bacterium]